MTLIIVDRLVEVCYSQSPPLSLLEAHYIRGVRQCFCSSLPDIYAAAVPIKDSEAVLSQSLTLELLPSGTCSPPFVSSPSSPSSSSASFLLLFGDFP